MAEPQLQYQSYQMYYRVAFFPILFIILTLNIALVLQHCTVLQMAQASLKVIEIIEDTTHLQEDLAVSKTIKTMSNLMSFVMAKMIKMIKKNDQKSKL